jgi:hypothetical protein
MRALMLIALGLSGCAAEAGGVPEQEWRYAVAHADCAPWDGAATTIELSDSPSGQPMTAPYLHISVYRGISDNAGRAVLDGMQSGSLSATMCTAEGACVSVDSGWVDLAPKESTLAGQYSLHLSDGRTISGKFTAPIISMRVLCG